jgi:hypothetical protein
MSQSMKTSRAATEALNAYRIARRTQPATIAMDVAIARYRAYFPLAANIDVKRALARHHARERMRARAVRKLHRLALVVNEGALAG